MSPSLRPSPRAPPFPLSFPPPLTNASSSPPLPLIPSPFPFPTPRFSSPPLPFPFPPSSSSCPALPLLSPRLRPFPFPLSPLLLVTPPLPSPRAWERGWPRRSGKQRHFIIFNKINSQGECCFCALSFHNDRQTLLFFLSKWRMGRQQQIPCGDVKREAKRNDNMSKKGAKKEVQMRSCTAVRRSVVILFFENSFCGGVRVGGAGGGRERETRRDGRGSCKRESCFERSHSRHFPDARA